ncbi:MAG: peptidase S41 [Thiotrichales bacterium SG8_50]|nr:MAG: peptidase S41 [Thiotrichales bacterium SG8_50]
MQNATRYILILVLGIFVGSAITLERAVRAERQGQEAMTPLPLDELRTFTEVFSRIQSDYVEPVDDKKILKDAIQGMLTGLDPHSSYLDPEGYKEMRIGTEGQFGGLGIEVTMENGFVKVVTPIEDTPAATAGVKTGDLIVKLDSKPVKGMTLTEAVRLMRGRPGSKIKLTIVREGEDKPLQISVMRAVIKLQSVKRKMLDKDYGYVRVTQFQGNSAKNLETAIARLRKDNKRPLKGMVLDLRNNPGGVLSGAVTISDMFLDKGLIVYTEGRTSDSALRYSATPGDVINGAPLVVLINGGSASASEIVAGALQDHKRAIIMGTRSFGKGSVQTILPMSNGAALKLTTARYYTPKGRSIQASGIDPDIVTQEAKLTVTEKRETLKEADLAGHLSNDKESDTTKNGKAGAAKANQDYQLQEALNLLKGINIHKQARAN